MSKKSMLALALVLSPLVAFGQVPDSIYEVERAAAYVVHNDGMVLYIPSTHEVVIQPKGGWNTAPLNWVNNPLGIHNNRWPLLDYLCKPQLSTGGPVGDSAKECNFPNYVVRK